MVRLTDIHIHKYIVNFQMFQEYQEGKRRHDEAMQSYRHRKHETFKKICKKTHKGQPIMKYQIEHLLEKIEKQVNYK